MKNRLLRFVSAILILSILIPTLGSCRKTVEPPTEYDDTTRLTVETVRVSYSNEYIEKTNLRFGDMACALLRRFYARELTPLHEQGIRMQFKMTFVPMFYRFSINEDKLDSLILAFEEYLSRDTERGDSLSVLREIYEITISVLGSEKTGRIAYEMVLSNVNNRLSIAEGRYDEYGYPWYLEEAERCRYLSTSLAELGERRFVEALDTMVFLYSVMSHVGVAQDSFLLTESEILYLVEYQAEYMENGGLSEEEWAVMGGVVDELLPDEAATPRDAMLYALKNEGYFKNALRTLPSLISLYADCASLVRRSGVSLSDSDALCKVLLKASLEGEMLRTVADKADSYAKTEAEAQKTILTTFGLYEKYLAFAEEYPKITSEELILRLEMAEELPAEECAAAIENAVISYLMGTAPYATFIFISGDL